MLKVIANGVKAVKNTRPAVAPLHGQAVTRTRRKDFEPMGAIGQEGLGLSNFFFGHGRFGFVAGSSLRRRHLKSPFRRVNGKFKVF